MKPDHEEQDQKIIKLLKDLRASAPNYPPELLAARRAAFLSQLEQLGAAEIDEELSARDQEIVRLLGQLKSAPVEYPPQLLAASRAAFLSQLEQLSLVETDEELSAGDQKIVQLLGHLKSAEMEYPSELLAARRSAFLRQAVGSGGTSLLDRLRVSITRIFPSKRAIPTTASTGFMRISLAIASLVAAVMIGSLLFDRAEQSFQPSHAQVAAAPTDLLPTSIAEVALTICQPGDRTPSCSPGELTPDQDLADPENGPAQPAVSKDARGGADGTHRAAHVNDGRSGASWVSDSPNSWIKIDLGKVTTINTVRLQKGTLAASNDNHLGQFVIAVALRDVYTDGNSSNDYTEYAQVFSSGQTGFNGTVSDAETISTRFPPTRARYVKITFEQAGAAIEEVGVFMAAPPVLAEEPTSRPEDDLPGITLTPIPTNTPLPVDTADSVSTGTLLPADTAVLRPTDTPPSSGTPTPLPTNTIPPADTATPVPTDPLPSETSTVLPTELIPPTAVLTTSIPPTVQAAPVSTDPIIVTGNEQTLTFTCNGNAAEIRGHANTVTLWGSCNSITVVGNGNQVFWQSGSPVITDRGTGNIISQR